MFEIPFAVYVGVGTAVGVLFLTIIATILLSDSAPRFQLRGKAAFVTGGSSGIGLAMSKMLLQKGCSVAMVARNVEKLRQAEAELTPFAAHGATVIGISADVMSAPAVSAAVEECVAKLGRLDVLVTSAGISKPGNFLELEIDEFDRMMRANYLGTVYATRACIPHLLKQKDKDGARVMFVSSMAGQAGVYGFTAYTPSKFAVRGFAEVIQMEFREQNIFFSVCNPPDTDTPMLAEENLIKPDECRIISEGAGLYSAEQVAGDMMDGLVNWRFFVHTGMDGFLLSRITAGFSPTSGFLANLFELWFLGVLRYVALGYLVYYRSVVKKCARKRNQARHASQPLLSETHGQ